MEMKPNILMGRYELGRLLGQGTFAKVYYARNLKTGESVAIKVMDKEKILKVGMIEQIKREISVMRLVWHPNIVRLYEVMARKSKADIWSCGVILFMLLASHLPFQDANLMVMYKKIYKGDFKCPPWFSSEVRRLVLRLLDPNPKTRITVLQLMEVSLFRRRFKRPQADNDVDVGQLEDVESAFPAPKPTCLNAFDIISLSPGFNLSGLFNDVVKQEESRFTSTQRASSIMSKLEEIASLFRFNFKKLKDCKVKLQGSEQGWKGHLSIDAEIFEVTPSLFVVELRKTGGDSLEYSKFCSQDLKPGLKDIVWTWDGNSQ